MRRCVPLSHAGAGTGRERRAARVFYPAREGCSQGNVRDFLEQTRQLGAESLADVEAKLAIRLEFVGVIKLVRRRVVRKRIRCRLVPDQVHAFVACQRRLQEDDQSRLGRPVVEGVFDARDEQYAPA